MERDTDVCTSGSTIGTTFFVVSSLGYSFFSSFFSSGLEGVSFGVSGSL